MCPAGAPPRIDAHQGRVARLSSFHAVGPTSQNVSPYVSLHVALHVSL